MATNFQIIVIFISQIKYRKFYEATKKETVQKLYRIIGILGKIGETVNSILYDMYMSTTYTF